MKASPEKIADALRVSLKETERLRQRNRRLREALREPIAIVGMSCRFPGGVDSPRELWRLVESGADAISAFPADRGWDLDRLYDPDPDQPNTSYAREGGFVYDAGEFDPDFFGVSPYQAKAMDPQLRILLEASWAALEDAGIDPQGLRGSQTGVYAGAMYHDYGWMGPDASEWSDFLATGGTSSVISGHVAYTLGLEGPTMTVDTACSSSLVAMHLASQALRAGECPLALAGGVTVLSGPSIFTQFSRQRGLAPDGRCKSFAEAADGAGFSEGVGTLVLERLSDAQENGRRILALIKGSAVNQDGASNGLTAPNGPSQERVIRQALESAGLEARDVDAVEAHGTGTTLGDPIEARALLATYGQDRERPLKLGSIKSNIGHAQAAAGVAGVIKMTEALREGVLPKTLHVDAPSSKVDWEAGEIELLTESVEWEANGKPRRAGISSFGASGTNAHLILEQAPDSGAPFVPMGDKKRTGSPTRALGGPIPLVLSAKAEAALAEAAERLAAHLAENPNLDLADVAYSLATTRSPMEHRAVALGNDREELLASLAALAPTKARDGKLAYLLTGQGSQRLGMGKELFESDAHFKEAFNEVCTELDQHLETPLQEIVFAKGKKSAKLLEDTTYAQPALFAIEVALYGALAKRGLKPDLLTGHSVGEIAAAHISGVLDLPDAAKLVTARGALMGALPEGGAMAAIEASEAELADSIEGKEQELAIAGLNSPTSTVISGTEQAVEEIRTAWEEKGRKTKRLAVSHAFHSPLMEPMLEQFAEVTSSLSYSEPKIPIVSNLTGELLTPEQATDPNYWVRHAREPVRFGDAIETLAAQGATTYLELGPDPVLTALARQQLSWDREGGVPLEPADTQNGGLIRPPFVGARGTPPSQSEPSFVPTLRENRAEAGAITTAIANVHAAGAKVDWGTFFAGTNAKRVPLPTYPFQRERYWIGSGMASGDLGAAGLRDAEHPLLGVVIEDPEGGGVALSGQLSPQAQPWLRDHVVAGTILLPGTAFLELALRAAQEVGAESVEELTLQAPLALAETGSVSIQVSAAGPDEEGRREIAIHSRVGGEGAGWVQHASGVLAQQAAAVPEPLDAWPPPGAEPLGVADLYERLAAHGLDYGPAFQGLTAAWHEGERIYAEVSLPEPSALDAFRFGIHPALLDAALHGVALAATEDAGELRLPFSWRDVSLQAEGARELRVCLSRDGEELALRVADGSGAPVAHVGSLLTRPLDPAALRRAGRPGDGLLALEWREAALAEREDPPSEVEALHCAADGAIGGAEAAREAAQNALDAVQRWLADEDRAESRLAFVTRGAMATADGERADPATAAIWGIVRSAQSEHPGRFALIDSDGSEASEGALPAALELAAEEPQLALRAGEALVPRLTRLGAAGERQDVPPLDPDRTVLIAGGTGGLGALIARHLAEHHGARHLLLVSRSGEDADGAGDLKEELEGLGAEATIAACDASDREALAGLLAAIPGERPLGAVIHCAGAIADGTVETLTPDQVDRVFAPKVDAAWNLHELTADADLSAFVLFSSAAGTLGGPGQANYAAANVFLDALAQARRADGLVATSIAWGLWERASGMAAGLGEADVARLRRSGIEPISDRRGLDLFDASLVATRPQVLAAPLDPVGLAAMAAAGALPPILTGLVRVPRRRRAASGSLAAKLASLPEADTAAFVLDLVRGEVAAVLGHAAAADVEPERAFQELGFDSLAAVELRNRLSAIAGMRLSATVVFDYPSSAALAEYLLAEATAGGDGRQVAVRAQASDEPIAIVGMACRYPGGVGSPAELWQLVAEGRDGIGEFPVDRGWDLERLYNPDPESIGTSYTREGGFLAAAGEFDAEFFGIAPREALFTDPQQRLLLESSWEALEDAGIDPASLRKSPTGVFAGVMYQDYGPAAGMTSSIVSGRVSYALGLEGPAITVDTACSSSLVSMHLASQALRSGECTLAMAGGVTALSTPNVFIEFSRQRGLAPDGRSKSFSEAADGVAWSEGVGVLVLERLSDAQRNGHEVLAVLKGSAVNQDGASNGLTAPNGPSQERVIRQALANARLEAKDVDVVEAHGTGTTLGDPIEAGALLATYGQDRETPLKLGSIKSNIGHTQAAAGVAGVIKMAMAMREGVQPKTLHVDAPSSKVDWEAGEIELLTEQVEWEANGGPRRAGISSFGISGTNAHVILEQAPATEPSTVEAEPFSGPIPLALSAKAEPALADAAERLSTHLKENPDLNLADVAYSLLTTRSAMEHRAVALGSDREELLASLADLAPTKAREGKLAYLLTGQGSQRLGMGKELYESDAHFEEAFDQICAELDQHLDTPLQEIVFAEGKKAQAKLEDTTYAQPALFAIEVALYKALAERGLKPDLLTGHSVGEIAAAHISGVLDIADAAKLVTARGALMGALPEGGAMAAIEASEQEIADSIEGRESELAIAGLNSPTSTVISGTEAAVEEIRTQWEDKGRKTKRLAVSHAFHSPLMEPMLEQFAEIASSLSFNEPRIPIVSNLTGELLTNEQATDPTYWVRHAREPVRFGDAIETLAAQGATTYLELGPDPVLTALAQQQQLSDGEGGVPLEPADTQNGGPIGPPFVGARGTPPSPPEASFVPTLRENRPEAGAINTAIANAHASGAKVDWPTFFAGTNAKRVPLPTYPFQRERYWLASNPVGADLAAAGLGDAGHPLLAAAVETPGDGGLIFSGRLSLATHPWLADHVVSGSVLLPGTALLEMALRAAEEVEARCVEELTLQVPLVLPEAGAVSLRVAVTAADGDDRRQISIHSRPDGEEAWVENASGSLSGQEQEAAEQFESWPPEGADSLDVAYLYDVLAEHGLEYGPAFQGLTAAWRDGERIFAEISLADAAAQEADRFGLHPALLDSALHAVALAAASGSGELRLPFSWGRVSLLAEGSRELRVRIDPRSEGAISLTLADASGAIVATVGSLAVRPLDPARLPGAGQKQERLLDLEWVEMALPEVDDSAAKPELLRCEVEAGAARAEVARKAVKAALEAIQEWLADESKAAARLALITEGAMAAAEGEAPDPAAAALWGLLRSAQSEHPGRFALIDTDSSEGSEAALDAALALSGEEPQLALREGVALAPRAVPLVDGERSLVPPPGPWRLDAPERGTLESLALVPSEAAPLGPAGVRLQIHAAGLNFRDLLVALGVYPGEAVIGSEGAGVVLETGPEVGDLSPGDRVMGLIPDAFAPLATTERDLLVPVPESWTFEQAAAMPLVFATACYGLVDLGALAKGEKVLIHAGAGGVGGAAIQLARRLGAEVFATASPAKWDALREAGLDDDHIASSRDLEFKDKFLENTGGEGVDLVLNALAGEFVDASLALLPRGGRFLEMGKTDIRDPQQVAAEHAGVSYRAFDLVEAGPRRTNEMLVELTGLFEQGELRHAPIASWDMREAPRAFRHLREGKNVGKIVLTAPPSIDPERTVLITGGTGGLGALIARHLVEQHGARHLLLVSRGGPEAEGAAELQGELEGLGAAVSLAACDVSDRAALERLLASIPAGHPLGAVIHCAGLLSDGTVETLSAEQVDRVFGAKVDGAWNLHELTAGADLAAFALFSSAVGALGGPGQGNYAAANVFLDALAARRQAEGLPAISIAWGLWEREGGMASGLAEADLARMRRGGIEALSDQRGLAFFDAALAAGRAAPLAIPLETAGLAALASAGALPPILSGLVRTPRRRSAASGSLAAKLAALPESEHEAFALDLVRGEVAGVLGHASAAEVEPGRAFQELGFDSLAAVELRNRLSAIAGVRIAATVVFDYPSSAALAEYLRGEATASGAAAPVAVRAQASEEPIAIVGMACRYPGGVGSPAELWQLVAEGRDGISGFPADRNWDLERLYDPDPESSGTSYTREGGFVADAAEFDAGFFGISPREALAMDPQQRLLLESCWEALEDAGIDPASVRKTPVGVFAGLIHQIYSAGPAGAASEFDGYRATGNTASVASGRVAYALGLEGPAITVDTACSSSLVAMHLASQALRGGECTLALAGGVTVFPHPGMFTEFSAQRGLAPDGRCKSFAEAADGTAWAEGVGVLVLERLSDAQRNGHEALALVKGSAVNQDGASNGLTAPNGPSQERVIRQALANARLQPKDVDVVEAHGTGTMLGDPIEAGALLATYGQDREQPLKLGSIKSNIGHAQAAAGVAGVIKMTQAMREGVLPKTLHVDAPSTKVDWEAGEIELLTEQVEWEANGAPRRAGISSFGISGTNAHVILEEAPAPSAAGASSNGDGGDGEESRPLPGPTLLPLSAKTQPALVEAAERLAAHLGENLHLDPVDVSYSLAATRTSFEHRAVVVGESKEELLASLAALAQGGEGPGLALGQAREEQKPLFLFPGQGAQAQGMALGLIESSPTFARHMHECERALAPHVDWSLAEVLGEEDAKWLDRLDIVQPALFAVMVSLAKLWRECGVEPGALIGHSQGEIAAAHISGALSLEDAALVIAHRGKAMAKIAGKGGMLSVSLSPEGLAPYIEPLGERVSLAAINGPSSLVLSGDPDALDRVQESCEADEVRAKRIAVDYAAHSSQIDELREELLEAFAPIAPQSTQVPLHSTVTGEPVDGAELGPEYWFRNLRQTVLLEPVLRSALAAGKRAFIEIGPHPVLAFGAQETFDAALEDPGEAILISTLRREEEEARRFALSLAEAHAKGMAVEWSSYFKGAGAKRVPLPTYPFQRKRYWLSSLVGPADASAVGQTAAEHPLLSAAIEDPAGEDLVLTGLISLSTHPWLADHALADTVLLPATAFLELAFRAGAEAGAESVEELAVLAPLVLPEGRSAALQVRVSVADEEGRRELSIHSRLDGEEASWALNAAGALSARAPEPVDPLPDTWPPADAEPLEVDDLYDRLAESGLEYGPAFQGIAAAWRDGGRVYAEASLPEAQAQEAERFGLHPALFEPAFQADVDPAGTGERNVALTSAWHGARLHRGGAATIRLVLAPAAEGGGVSAFGADGAPIFSARSVESRALDPAELRSVERRRSLHRLEWQPVATPGAGLQSELPEPEVVEIHPAEGDVPEAAQATAERVLELLQGWIGEERPQGSRLVFLTRNAVGVEQGESPELAAATAWGLVRSAISEHPGRFALVDADTTESSLAAVPAALGIVADQPQIALRGGEAFIPRLSRLSAEEGSERSSQIDPEGTVLLTGAQGVLVARHLAERHGARHLLLVSDSDSEAGEAGELRAELEGSGVGVTVAACDVADREALERVFASVPAEHPLDAIVHTAGPLDDGVLDAMDAERIARTMGPKAIAAWHLHELSKDMQLSQFVLFSSVAGLLGGAAQANYAAANNFVDALAHRRRSAGLPATSLAWGLWDRQDDSAAGAEGDGEAERLASQIRQRLGLAPMDARQGLELFDAARELAEPLLAPVCFDGVVLREQATAGALPAVLRDLVPARARRGADRESLARRLAGVAEGEREMVVLDLVRSHVAVVLGHASSAEVDPEQAFQEMGFDSLAAVELRNRLSGATGLQLPTTLVFDYPSASAIAARLLTDVGADAETEEGMREREVGEILATLEATLSALAPTDGARERTGARLRSLLVSLSEAGLSEDGGSEEDLAAMSDEEMFELIDEEFGKGSADGG